MKATQYEKALIRLKAFKQLEGWGTKLKDTGGIEPFTLEVRMDKAGVLAEWALGEEPNEPEK